MQGVSHSMKWCTRVSDFNMISSHAMKSWFLWCALFRIENIYLFLWRDFVIISDLSIRFQSMSIACQNPLVYGYSELFRICWPLLPLSGWPTHFWGPVLCPINLCLSVCMSSEVCSLKVHQMYTILWTSACTNLLKMGFSCTKQLTCLCCHVYHPSDHQAFSYNKKCHPEPIFQS